MKKSPSQRISNVIATRIGWRVEAKLPVPQKCVIIGAPHTSGADLFATFLLMGSLGMKFHWVAKDSLFRGPLGWSLRSLGGIPVNRREQTGFVQRMASMFPQRDVFRLAILPEGTRSRANYWKTGFYYIAQAAGVPIILGFADYKRKVVGLGPSLIPAGDIQADFQKIRTFYTGITGRYSHKQGEIRIRQSAQDPGDETYNNRITQNLSQESPEREIEKPL